MTDAARGRLAVRPTSWHYRVHAWWAREKGKAERPTDLCHYFWRVVLWAPLRYFFTCGPALILSALAVVAFLVVSVVRWGGDIAHAIAYVAEHGWIVLVAAFGVFAAGVALVLLLRLALGWHMNVVERRLNKAEDAMAKAWYWLWTTPLFRLRGLPIPPFAVVLAAAYAVALYFSWKVTLFFTVATVAVVAALFGVVVAIVFLADLSKDRKQRKIDEAKSNPKPEAEPEPDVEREPSWSGLRMLWAFLVAKKHRICPLIEVRGAPFGGGPTGPADPLFVPGPIGITGPAYPVSGATGPVRP